MSTVSPPMKENPNNPRTTAADLFDDGTKAFQFFFRFGNRPPMSKVFLFAGSHHDAIERAKKHCEKMNYRFCGCYPFIVDLDMQEQLRNDDLGLGEY